MVGLPVSDRYAPSYITLFSLSAPVESFSRVHRRGGGIINLVFLQASEHDVQIVLPFGCGKGANVITTGTTESDILLQSDFCFTDVKRSNWELFLPGDERLLIICVNDLFAFFSFCWCNFNHRRTLDLVLAWLNALRECSASYICRWRLNWAQIFHLLCFISGNNCALSGSLCLILLFLVQRVFLASDIDACAADSVRTAEHVSIIDAVEAFVVEILRHTVFHSLSLWNGHHDCRTENS